MKKIFIMCCLFIVSTILLRAGGDPAAGTAPDFEILRFDPYHVVRMSGGMTDDCWSTIPVCDKFNPAFKGGRKPINHTEARIFYNASNIYIGLDLFESEMDRIKLGLPAGQSDDIPINSSDDCAEILIWNPYLKDVHYHLRVVPSGAKDDARYGEPSKRDSSWNGSWEIRTKRLSDRWQAEIRIPLEMFAEAEKGWMFGTPVPKNMLKMNIGRICSTAAEFSHLAPLPGGFHNQKATFKPSGFSAGGNIWLEQEGCQRLKNGENILNYQIMNDVKRPAEIMLTAVLIEEETDLGKRAELQRKTPWKRPVKKTVLMNQTMTIAPGETLPLQLKFDLTNGGKKTVKVLINWTNMKSAIYAGTLCDDVYDLKSENEKLGRRIEEAKVRLSQCTLLPADHPIRMEADTILKEIDRLHKNIESSPSLTEHETYSRETAIQLEKLEYLISVKMLPFQWAKKILKKAPSFSLGVVPSGEKVFRHKPFPGKFQEQISLSIAGNEYRSTQFVLFFLRDKAAAVKCSVSDFKGPDGALIPASNCFFNPVGYVNINAGVTQNPDDYWPDVLYNGNEIIQGKYPLQPVMFTIKANENQPPGKYIGTISFSDGTDRLSIQAEVNVYPFSLPRTRSLRMNIWFAAYRVMVWYKQFPKLEESLFSQIMELCGKYNFAVAPRWNFWSHTPVREKDGKYIFDFSRLKTFYDIALKNGANCINFQPASADFFRTTPLIAGPNGKKQKLAGDPEELAADAFLQLLAFFKENGYEKYALLQVGDEPWSREAQEDIRKKVSYYRTLNGDIPPVITAGTNRKESNLEGFINYWCPQFNAFNPYNYTDLGKDEQLWFYQCLYKPDFPAYQINRPSADARIAGFMCWKYQAKGFQYWTAEQWAMGSFATPENQNKLKNRWIHEEWGFPIKNHPGDGCFIYPMPEGVIASFRAQQIRESVDDYEYMTILKAYYEKAKSMNRLTPELAKRAEEFLRIPDSIVKMTNFWTKSTEQLDAFRDEVGKLNAELINLCGM